MSKPIFISIKDIQRIKACSYPTACRQYKIIKDALGKRKNQQLLIREYLEYEGLQLSDIGM